MDQRIVDMLDGLIERDALWEEAELGPRVRHLAASATPAAQELAGTFRALQLRLGMGPVSDRLRREVEGVLYPQLWKALEAVRIGLPPEEALARVQVLNRRLARIFAEEKAGQPTGEQPDAPSGACSGGSGVGAPRRSDEPPGEEP